MSCAFDYFHDASLGSDGSHSQREQQRGLAKRGLTDCFAVGLEIACAISERSAAAGARGKAKAGPKTIEDKLRELDGKQSSDSSKKGWWASLFKKE